MRELVQFRLNIQEDTSSTQNVSGSYSKFLLTEVAEESPNVRDETFIKLQEQITTEWNWVEERCIICFSPIKPDDQMRLWKCPHCAKVAHFDHVESWLQRKQKCPVCRQPVYL